MATTIVPQNLTVTISESYTLNGVDMVIHQALLLQLMVRYLKEL